MQRPPTRQSAKPKNRKTLVALAGRQCTGVNRLNGLPSIPSRKPGADWPKTRVFSFAKSVLPHR